MKGCAVSRVPLRPSSARLVVADGVVGLNRDDVVALRSPLDDDHKNS